MTTTSLFTTKRNEPPTCFGKDWDRNAPECAGGPDVSFIPSSGEKYAGQDLHGTNVRLQCDWFQSCGSRCAAGKNAHGTLVPAQQLLRSPPPPVPQPTSAPMTYGQWLARQNTKPAPTAVPAQPQAPQVLANAAVQPATMWQLNYAMPSYLSTPEIRHPGESIWSVLLREVLRAIGKAVGHSVSHFFDARVLKEK